MKFLLCLLLFFVPSLGIATTVRVSALDNGKTITLAKGDVLRVDVTGFGWKCQANTGGVVVPATRLEARPKRVRQFRFKASAKGSGALEFVGPTGVILKIAVKVQ